MKRNAILKTMVMLLLAAVSISTFHNYLVNGTPGTVTKTSSILSWSLGAVQAGWHGWWFRLNTQWFQFDFSDVHAWGNIIVDLHLPVTNHMDGETGLDGLIDVVINPGGAPTTTYTNVLLDNWDPNNHVYIYGLGGSYGAHGQITVPNSYVISGQITIRVVRHTDNDLANAAAKHCTNQPIDMGPPIVVPSGVYENDDAHTVHIFVWCQDGDGGHIVTDEGGWGYVALTYEGPVGGVVVPVDKFGLLAPYIGLASTILVATVATAIYVKRVNRRQKKQ